MSSVGVEEMEKALLRKVARRCRYLADHPQEVLLATGWLFDAENGL